MNKSFIIYLFISFITLHACSNEAEKDNSQAQSNSKEEIVQVDDPQGLMRINKMIENYPNEAQLYFLRGEYFYTQEGYDQAIRDLSKAIQLDSTKSTYWHSLSNAYMDYFKSQEALSVMREASARFPDSVYTQLKLSETQLIMERHQEAMATLTKIKQKDEFNADAHYMMGLVFSDLGEVDNAIVNFQQCVELDPKFIESWVELGNLWAQKENGNDPNLYFDNALRLDTAYIPALFSKARYAMNNEDLEQSLSIFDKLSQLYPSDESYFYNKGNIHMRMENWEEAVKELPLP